MTGSQTGNQTGIQTDIHVDDFCKDAALALSVLYQAFPRPHTLFVEDLIGADEVDEFGMHSTRHLACFSAIVWLAEEGWLRFGDTIRQDAVDQAVLSGRAFSLLSTPAPGFAPPDAAELPASVRVEQQTHIARLRRALQERSSAGIRSAVLELMVAMQARPPLQA
jgi:hypothetical protein